MKNTKEQVDPLVAELCREAAKDSPRFSPLLHERIMRRISSASAPGSVAHVLRWRWVAPVGVAAAITLAFCLHDWSDQPVPHPVPPHVQVASGTLLTMPPLGEAVADISDPAAQRLQAARYAYLDQDAQRFTRYMIDQINVLPSRR